MIVLNTGTKPRQILSADQHAAEYVGSAPWIDLCDPTDWERAIVEQATGLRLPSREELSEIESSSRLSQQNGVITLSTPLVARSNHAEPVVAPLGFVLTRDRLITLRFTESRSFDVFTDRFCGADQQHTGPGAFLGLLESIVDRLADILEQVGADLDSHSRIVFQPEMANGSATRRADAALRVVLRGIGRSGDLLSRLRDSLLGLGRIIGYVTELWADWMPPEMVTQFRTIRADLQSLNDYDQQLSNKTQFLLDATLGFINIQQNNIIKLLTVVSIAGIPPTLIAGIYGMNFVNIPELKWAHGYAYSLVLMLLSAALPLIWLRRRGWM